MSRILSNHQRIEIVQLYQAHSATETIQIFNQRYPHRVHRLNPRTVRKIGEKFKEHGSVQTQTALRRSKSCNPQTIRNVEALFEDNCHMSLRQAQRDTALGIKTIRKCIKAFHPYKFVTAVVSKQPQDFMNRLAYCNTIVRKIRDDAQFLWSDESIFQLNGTPNRQNYRYVLSYPSPLLTKLFMLHIAC